MTKVLIGIAVAFCIIIGLTLGGIGQYQSFGSVHGLTVEKAFASKAIPNSIGFDKKLAQDNPVFSWTMTLYLIATVIGIVAFRRDNVV
jgi:hypothetical protein